MASLKGFERSKRLHRIAEAIEKRGDELARLLTLDQGKPLKAEAMGEVAEAVEYFRIAAEDLKRLEGRVLPSASPTKLVLARHYPRGVYGIITPWNWPLTMAAELIAPALAAGNTFVWTPASSTSVISVALMECIAEGDFPAGAVNLVTGLRHQSNVSAEPAGADIVAGGIPLTLSSVILHQPGWDAFTAGNLAHTYDLGGATLQSNALVYYSKQFHFASVDSVPDATVGGHRQKT